MERLLALLARILDLVLDLVEDFARRREERRRQDEADRLEDAPGEWFESEFGGLRPVRDGMPKPEAAAEAESSDVGSGETAGRGNVTE